MLEFKKLEDLDLKAGMIVTPEKDHEYFTLGKHYTVDECLEIRDDDGDGWNESPSVIPLNFRIVEGDVSPIEMYKTFSELSPEDKSELIKAKVMGTPVQVINLFQYWSDNIDGGFDKDKIYRIKPVDKGLDLSIQIAKEAIQDSHNKIMELMEERNELTAKGVVLW